MRVVIAPDSFGGTLTAVEAATAIADGWSAARPDDDLVVHAMSDGGEGLLDVIDPGLQHRVHVEVAGPLGHPVDAQFVHLDTSTAIVESAQACGLTQLPGGRRDPMRATTYGVGQLIDEARRRGVSRILVGLGGSATVDAGAGALAGLGMRLLDAHGDGVKIGGGDIDRVVRIDRGWCADFAGVEILLLYDVETTLLDAPRRFGPQKGAGAGEIATLTESFGRFADIAETQLADGRSLRDESGSGAAGGLGFGLACAFDGSLSPGVDEVARITALDRVLDQADLIVTGEGRLDATSAAGKVVVGMRDLARRRGQRCLAVVGRIGDDAPELDAVEAASPDGPGADPAGDVAAAARRLAEAVDEAVDKA